MSFFQTISPSNDRFQRTRREAPREYVGSSSKRSALMVVAVVAVLGALSLLVAAQYQGSHQSQLRSLQN